MVQTDRQTPLSPLDYHYNVVEFSRYALHRSAVSRYKYNLQFLYGPKTRLLTALLWPCSGLKRF